MVSKQTPTVMVAETPICDVTKHFIILVKSLFLGHPSIMGSEDRLSLRLGRAAS